MTDVVKTRAEQMWETVNAALDSGPVDVGPFVVGECTLSEDRRSVTVWTLAGDHRKDYVITNPPLLVADPQGDVMVGTKMYRQDPLAVLEQIFRRVESGQ